MAVESPLTAARVIERMCPWPEGHLQRVAGYSAQLAAAAALDGAVPVVAKAALLHEIGKLALPEELLARRDRLTPPEAEALRRHVVAGAEMCRSLPDGERIAAIVRHCHEHWNGQGYPDRLAGEQIPIGARIVAIADAFDTLMIDRPWRSAYSPEEALQILWFGADTQWDPHLVELFDQLVRPTLVRRRT
ncbi:MAG: HD domain-containing phosphohydrolase [Armatimonadota bacterium]|nr:HD domain-containing phosphohydrolase [Armatimonadota bacterium]MDR7422187.1 HD domain-containing phosphohydrolase [Armatimonadota bacterium]MDR7453101.1 HD domain-containing phosphohydrolase [Armatimonadota bacterium]MDR7458018.1 HD domain-containing phosphohydrolase [Armatimonadota bacterium]MDR7495790.1 HD domain-containing phosphohydrolase [Armatimonadota bacterium]